MVAPSPVRAPSETADHHVDRPWVVIVWDDPVNLMDYVVFVFQEVLLALSLKQLVSDASHSRLRLNLCVR